jgi:hypothetical protein
MVPFAHKKDDVHFPGINSISRAVGALGENVEEKKTSFVSGSLRAHLKAKSWVSSVHTWSRFDETVSAEIYGQGNLGTFAIMTQSVFFQVSNPR